MDQFGYEIFEVHVLFGKFTLIFIFLNDAFIDVVRRKFDENFAMRFEEENCSHFKILGSFLFQDNKKSFTEKISFNIFEVESLGSIPK